MRAALTRQDGTPGLGGSFVASSGFAVEAANCGLAGRPCWATGRGNVYVINKSRAVLIGAGGITRFPAGRFCPQRQRLRVVRDEPPYGGVVATKTGRQEE